MPGRGAARACRRLGASDISSVFDEAAMIGEGAFRSLIAALPVPLIVTRSDTRRILFANAATAAFFGMPTAEIVGRDSTDLFEDARERDRMIATLRETGELTNFEARMRGAGPAFQALISLRVASDAGGRLFVSSLVNIEAERAAQTRIETLMRRVEQQNAELERRVAERTAELATARDEAARAERQLVEAIEAITEGFVLWDAQDRFVLCNSRYRNEFSLSPELLAKGTPFETILRQDVARGLFPEDDHAEGWISRRLAERRSPATPYVMARRDGRWVRLTEYRTREGGLVAIRTDITDLMRREHALSESQRLLRAVIDAVPAIINVKDRDSRYILMNRFQGEVYGVDPDAAIGRISTDFVGAVYGGVSLELDRQVVDTGVALPFGERDFVDVSGVSHTWLTAKLPLVDPDRGQVTNVVTVALDISDLKATERARTNLSRYFAPNLVEILAENDEPFGPARAQSLAVLFVDIIGFTGLCAEQAPEDVFALLRDFQNRMASCIFRHEGTLDKYIGDAVMATFGTPESGPDDATRALRCATAMLGEIADLNAGRTRAGRSPIGVGIGLHYGAALLGNVGSEQRLEFAVIGDTVNVASRLEKLARPLGVSLLASQELVERAMRESGADAPEVAGLRQLGPQPIRGRQGPVTVWTMAEPV